MQERQKAALEPGRKGARNCYSTFLFRNYREANIYRGDSDFDIRHSFTAGVTYDLPSPGSHKAVLAILGGWSLNSFLLARSAPPVDVVSATRFVAGTALSPLLNVNPGVPLERFGSQYPGGKIFNRAAFTAPPLGQ